MSLSGSDLRRGSLFTAVTNPKKNARPRNAQAADAQEKRAVAGGPSVTRGVIERGFTD